MYSVQSPIVILMGNFNAIVLFCVLHLCKKYLRATFQLYTSRLSIDNLSVSAIMLLINQ